MTQDMEKVIDRIVVLARGLGVCVESEKDAITIATIDCLLEDLEWLRKEIGER